MTEYIESFLSEFDLSDDVLRNVSNILFEEMQKGLNNETYESSCLKMLPTFVRDVPNGSEEGTFLALDLGGSRFRILCIELQGPLFSMKSEVYEIPQRIMEATGETLFKRIVDCLEAFLYDNNLRGRRLPLGFTFSFPCIQHGLTSATLVRWTKGFSCSDVEGRDVVQLLRNALERKQLEIDIIVVVNDTTGTLISCAHVDKECRIGVIIGTGTNACYMEQLENVGTWTGNNDEPRQVIINTEWGAFGDNGCLDFMRTNIDHVIDDMSQNRGSQIFEKMISGMYMGEIVRKIVCQFSEEGLIFSEGLSEKFREKNRFKSKYVSYVEKYAGNNDKIRDAVLKKMDIANASDGDCGLLLRVCASVSRRSAFMVGAAVATLLNKMKRPYTVIGVDGSVYRYHPHLKTLMEEKITLLTDPNYKFKLMLSEDGSGRGAALVCAVASRQLNW